MIGSIHFKNFRVLREATLPLSPFTLIVGPNGSGKSTVFRALQAPSQGKRWSAARYRHSGSGSDDPVELEFFGAGPSPQARYLRRFAPNQVDAPEGGTTQDQRHLNDALHDVRVYSLDPESISSAVPLDPGARLGSRGENLAVVLDQLRDAHPERFEQLNTELNRWLPEFDRVLFSTPATGLRSLQLRTGEGSHVIPAENLSQGTLIALALLTLAYLPSPPRIVGLEEPDRGLHPRLLREVRDAIYRLTNPASHGEKRDPVQVIATTHSPLFLDLFREHPEEIVIAEKRGLEATFQRLSDRPDLEEILRDASLGEVWYSGILGGVPATP